MYEVAATCHLRLLLLAREFHVILFLLPAAPIPVFTRPNDDIGRVAPDDASDFISCGPHAEVTLCHICVVTVCSGGVVFPEIRLGTCCSVVLVRTSSSSRGHLFVAILLLMSDPDELGCPALSSSALSHLTTTSSPRASLPRARDASVLCGCHSLFSRHVVRADARGVAGLRA